MVPAQVNALLENFIEVVSTTKNQVLAVFFVLSEILALLTVPSVLLRRRGRPTVALTWLFALVALPGIGSLFWWTFGRTRIERRKRKRTQKKKSYIARHGSPEPQGATVFDHLMPPRAHGESVFNSQGNDVRLLSDGASAFSALEAAIEDATQTIHLLYYIFQDDETGRRIARKLIERAQRGVTVRVLLDGFGSQRQTRKLRRELERGGVQLAYFLPSSFRPSRTPRINFTNHRKIAVFDQQIAFTGGMNIGAEYERSWRDVMVRIEGPAVSGLHHVFLEDWFFATNEALFDHNRDSFCLVPQGIDVAVIASGPDTEPWIHDAYFLSITRAEKRVWIVTPYFIPSPEITAALRTAAGRGLDVRIIVPDDSDVALVKWASRSFYRALISAGVRIFEYGGPMLHAKLLIVDEEICAVGTANIDTRSFGLSFEVCCFLASTSLNHELERWIDELIPNSLEIDTRALERKSNVQKVIESAAHLLSPIL